MGMNFTNGFLVNEELLLPAVAINTLQQPVLNGNGRKDLKANNTLPGILFITSYPPKECGIATYSQDLVKALNNKFNQSFKIRICQLETENEGYPGSEEVSYKLATNLPSAFTKLAADVNKDAGIRVVMIQHEFGFFKKE
jgi:hypothetical protein